MLKGVFDQLSELGNLVPRYTGPRCLLERHTVGGCDACHSACPHEAIETPPGTYGVRVDPQKCTGCGLCVQACPTGALEYDLMTPLQSVHDQREQPAESREPSGPPEATLTCVPSGAGGPSLPCLGRVTPALVAAAGAWDVPLTLIHGDCAACPVGRADVPERLGAVVEQAQTLRAATGRPARVTVRAAVPEDQGRALKVSRRGAFTSLLRAGSRQISQNLPERPLPFVDWSDPPQRTPQEWTWRRKALKPVPPAGVGVVWPAPLVDEKCIDCPVCANVCPTEAITRELRPEGGVRLLLNLGACTGCMACLHSCPPGAIHEQKEWLLAAFDVQILLRESDHTM